MEETKKEIYYIFLGYGGENSLMPLADHLYGKGEKTLVIDDQRYPFTRAEMLEKLKYIRENFRVVLISSSHVWFDQATYRYFDLVDDPQVLSPLEMLGYLKPDLSVYYPHDMSEFVHDSELQFLENFDIVMLPYRNNRYYRIKHIAKRTEVVGWVKKRQTTAPHEHQESTPYTAMFFPSYVPDFYQRLGVDGFADWFRKYIDKDIHIKMGAGDAGVRPILDKEGYTFLDTSLTVYDAVNTADLVIGSGTSSIIFEAALSGIPAVSLLDGNEPDEVIINAVGDIPGVYTLHPDELKPFLADLNCGKKELVPGLDVLKPFEFDRVQAILADEENNS